MERVQLTAAAERPPQGPYPPLTSPPPSPSTPGPSPSATTSAPPASASPSTVVYLAGVRRLSRRLRALPLLLRRRLVRALPLEPRRVRPAIIPIS